MEDGLIAVQQPYTMVHSNQNRNLIVPRKMSLEEHERFYTMGRRTKKPENTCENMMILCVSSCNNKKGEAKNKYPVSYAHYLDFPQQTKSPRTVSTNTNYSLLKTKTRRKIVNSHYIFFSRNNSNNFCHIINKKNKMHGNKCASENCGNMQTERKS